MSKNIKAGSWWLDEDGDIVYVAFNRGQLPFHTTEDDDDDEPIMVWHNQTGGTEAACLWVEESALVRELPGCTGFDYKVPPEIPHSSVMNVPPQWIPYVDGEGKEFLILGYLRQPVDATAG